MLAHVAARLPDRDGRGVRLRRAGEVDRGLREVQLRLGQADVLERLRRRDRDDERVRIGVADVLGGEDDHAPRDEARILARFEHRGEVVDGGVRVAAAHRLDERRREVVVLVALAVVEERALPRCVEDVLFGERRRPPRSAVAWASSRIWSAARASPPPRSAMSARALRVGASAPSSRHRAPRISTSSSSESAVSSITVQRESSAELTSKYGFSVVAPMSVTSPSSTACSTESCCALLKRWISSMKRIVRTPLPPSRSLRSRDDRPHVVDARRHGRELLERRSGPRGDDPRDRRLPGARRAEEDHRRRAVLLDRAAQRRSGPEHVLLTDEVVERRRPQPHGERGVLGLPLARGFREEVGHARSMLPAG